jgi:hypothetical protein
MSSGFVAFAEEFAGGFDPCVVPVPGAWPKREGISVESNRRARTQKTADDLLMFVPQDIEICCPRTALVVFAASSSSLGGGSECL